MVGGYAHPTRETSTFAIPTLLVAVNAINSKHPLSAQPSGLFILKDAARQLCVEFCASAATGMGRKEGSAASGVRNDFSVPAQFSLTLRYYLNRREIIPAAERLSHRLADYRIVWEIIAASGITSQRLG